MTTLESATKIYNKCEYELCWRYFNRRGDEFLSKYSQFLDSSARRSFEQAIKDDQPDYQYATDAWASRNAYRNVLRILEQRKDRIQDTYLMQRPERARFGR